MKYTPLLLSIICLPGCGVGQYEERMEHTRKFYEHVNQLNAAVTPTPWQGPGVTFRLPQPFVPENNDPKAEPKQPFFLNSRIPGLAGVWHAKVPTELGGKIVEVPAFCLVFSNYELLASDGGDDGPRRKRKKEEIEPENYNRELGNLLVGDPAGNLSIQRRRIPRLQPAFSRVKQFDVLAEEARINLRPVRPIKEVFGNAEMGVTLYQIENGAVQVTIAFVIPRAISPDVRMTERIEYSLETLSMASRAASPGDSGPAGTGGGGPAI